MRSLLLAFVTVVSGVVLAQEPQTPEFERRLVPISVNDAPGAEGTRWTSRAEGFRERDGVLVLGLNYVNIVLPGPAGHFGGSFFPTSPGEPPGSIVYVPREHAAEIHLVADLYQSGGLISDKVSLPVVPEGDFFDRPIYFIGLEDNPAERTHLRIYSLDLDQPSVDVRLTITGRGDFGHWMTLFDEILPLAVHQRMSLWPYHIPLRIRPWAAEISLDSLLQPTPETPGTRIWAFVSETDSHTQRVQLALPQ